MLDSQGLNVDPDCECFVCSRQDKEMSTGSMDQMKRKTGGSTERKRIRHVQSQRLRSTPILVLRLDRKYA